MKTKLVRMFLAVSLLTMGLFVAIPTPTFACHVDLKLDKDLDTPSPYAVGDLVTFSITVTNEGSLDATGVQVKDFNWTSNLQYASDDSGGVYDSVSKNVLWDVGDLPVGASATMHITFTIISSFPEGFVNDAEIYACDQPDVDSTPNNGWVIPLEDDIAEAGGSVTPTAVTLSSFAAKTSPGPEAPLAWPWLVGVAMLAMGGVLWVRRRSNRLGRTDY